MRAMRCFQVFALTAAIYSVGSVAYAGELKFGEGMSSLETDDKGKLTDAGEKSALKKLDKIPGEDAWDLKVWAKLDHNNPGPLYVEFFQTINGEQHIVWRYEDGEYQGEKHYSMSIVLEGNNGFNKDREYYVKVIQVNDKGKDVKMADGKIKLINTGREPEEGGDGDGDEEEDVSEQDALDSFATGDDEEEVPDEDPSTGEAPPETEASKKGCSVTGNQGLAWNGLIVLAMLGGIAVRRRR